MQVVIIKEKCINSFTITQMYLQRTFTENINVMSEFLLYSPVNKTSISLIFNFVYFVNFYQAATLIVHISTSCKVNIQLVSQLHLYEIYKRSKAKVNK